MQRSLEDLPALDMPDEVEIILVQTVQDQVEWLEVLMRGFPEPEEARTDCRQYLQHFLTDSKSAWHHFLARWQGEPCAISTPLCTQGQLESITSQRKRLTAAAG